MPIREQEPVFADVAPMPRPAVMGDNNPPAEDRIKVDFKEALLEERPDFLAKYEAAIEAADRALVKDDNTLGRAGELVKLYRAMSNHIADVHKTVKEPYLQGGRAVDAEKTRLLGPVDDARNAVQGRMNEFMAQREAQMRAEQARIAEDQRQRAAEAAEGEAAPLAPAAPVKSEPVRSDGGATVSGREVWNSRVDDYAAAFRAVKTNPKVKEAIDKAVAGLVRAGTREIKGVTIWPTSQAVAR